MDLEFANLVELAAEARGNQQVPRKFIDEAIAKIEKGEMKTEQYPSGMPSLRGVYDIALALFRSSGN